MQAIIHCDLNSKETKRGGDYRLTCIHVIALLRNRQTPPLILQLMETAVEMSDIMYADENKRSPKLIFKFHNVTWLHFELCKELLSSPKSLTHRKMFGMYLHAISVHAPSQYEIVNLKTTNTEHEERLFGQAKDIAQKASNRQPNTVIPSILLRIQAKQENGVIYTSYKELCSQVAKAAEELHKNKPRMQNTEVSRDFLTSRMSSWQQHLRRVSPFLKYGPGVWWHQTNSGYEFHDGSVEPDYREGTALLHCRDKNIKDIQVTKQHNWEELCKNKIELPTTFVTVYQENGDYLEKISFSHDHTQTEELGTESEEEIMEECTNQLSVSVQEEHATLHSEHDQDADKEHSMSGDVLIQDIEMEQTILPTYKTKLAAAVFQALGDSSLLRDLDELRFKMKREPCPSASLRSTYKKAISSTRARVRTVLIETNSTIDKLEKSFYVDKNCLPTDELSEYTILCKKVRFLKKLLHSADFV